MADNDGVGGGGCVTRHVGHKLFQGGGGGGLTNTIQAYIILIKTNYVDMYVGVYSIY